MEHAVSEGPTSKRGASDDPKIVGDTSAASTREASTEARNPKASRLATLTTREILELMNDEDSTLPAAVP